MKKRQYDVLFSDENARKSLKQIFRIEYDRVHDFCEKINTGLKEHSISEEFYQKIYDINLINQFIDTLSTAQLCDLNHLVELLIESSALKYDKDIETRVQNEIKDLVSMYSNTNV